MLNVRAQDGDVSTVDGQLLGEVDGQCRLRPGSARAPAGSRLELNGRISRQAGNKARQGTARAVKIRRGKEGVKIQDSRSGHGHGSGLLLFRRRRWGSWGHGGPSLPQTWSH